MTDAALRELEPGRVRLVGGLQAARFGVNRRYLESLESRHLLQNHLAEAGLWSAPGWVEQAGHRGWESPESQVRGQFLGHWLSAAARTAVVEDDDELRVRCRHVISELARCQAANGGEWVFSVPERYLHWTAQGRPMWASIYVCHKTLMGLLDAAILLDDGNALDILSNAAAWFHRWLSGFDAEARADVLDHEVGGMLEVMAGLYAITKEQSHADLMSLFDRRRLFDALIAGDDVLTDQHANWTIPEVHGAARAWEVTGDSRWRTIVENYWSLAVTERGAWCTGGQTSAEVWTPPRALAARRGALTQEHCTVYNMVRLADYLLRWTGDEQYAAYIERNTLNGVLAQQHPDDGVVTYFLPLHGGARKTWATPTESFWCCTGTMVQAQASLPARVAYRGDDGALVVTQYEPAEIDWGGGRITIRHAEPAVSTTLDVREHVGGGRPHAAVVTLDVAFGTPTDATVRLRLPDWLADAPTVAVDGVVDTSARGTGVFIDLRRRWAANRVDITLPRAVRVEPLPDEPSTAALLDGPVVLATECDHEPVLAGGLTPRPDDERGLGGWNVGRWRILDTNGAYRLRPLYEIVDERYSVYFSIRPPGDLSP